MPLLKDAGEFTEKEWETHKQKHPDADPKDHKIVKTDDKGDDSAFVKPIKALGKVLKGMLSAITSLFDSKEKADQKDREIKADAIKQMGWGDLDPKDVEWVHENGEFGCKSNGEFRRAKMSKSEQNEALAAQSESVELGEQIQKSKAELIKDYQEAIRKSDMSPEDKEKALEQSKKPDFDPEKALNSMSEDEEEEQQPKTANRSLVRRVMRAKYDWGPFAGDERESSISEDREADKDGNYMSIQNLKDIHTISGELSHKIQAGDDLEDWVEDKISAARQILSDLERFYNKGWASDKSVVAKALK